MAPAGLFQERVLPVFQVVILPWNSEMNGARINMHKPIHKHVNHENRRRNKIILDPSSLLFNQFHWPGTRIHIRPSVSSAMWLTQTCNERTAAAVGLPTRITNNAGATKAQIAPFSSESQQL